MFKLARKVLNIFRKAYHLVILWNMNPRQKYAQVHIKITDIFKIDSFTYGVALEITESTINDTFREYLFVGDKISLGYNHMLKEDTIIDISTPMHKERQEIVQD